MRSSIFGDAGWPNCLPKSGLQTTPLCLNEGGVCGLPYGLGGRRHRVPACRRVFSKPFSIPPYAGSLTGQRPPFLPLIFPRDVFASPLEGSFHASFPAPNHHLNLTTQRNADRWEATVLLPAPPTSFPSDLRSLLPSHRLHLRNERCAGGRCLCWVFSTRTSCSGSRIVWRHVKPIRLQLVVQYTLIDVSIPAASASSAANGVKGFPLLSCVTLFPP